MAPPKIEKKSRRLFQTKDSLFERVKSESKDDECQDKKNMLVDKSSFLLCPKPNEISFESSKQIMKEMRREKIRKDFELPEIMPHKQNNAHSKSTATRSKHMASYLRESSNPEDERQFDQIPPKYYDFKQPKQVERLLRKNNNSCLN